MRDKMAISAHIFKQEAVRHQIHLEIEKMIFG